jgi:hypothetical protein
MFITCLQFLSYLSDLSKSRSGLAERNGTSLTIGEGFLSCVAPSALTAPARDQVVNQYDHCYDQHYMNQTAADMADESE